MLSAELTRSGLPTILLGDSNIPIPPDGTPLTGDNLVSLQNVTTRSGLAWAEPSNPMTTQCNPDYNSMLDQIFVPASFSDRTQAAILFPEANYCDNDPNGFADHRPIKATISDFLQAPSPAATTSAAISAAADGLDIDELEERAQRLDRPGDVLSE